LHKFRPTFLLVDIVLVFVGGTLGTASRLGISRLQPANFSVPVAVLSINVLGALALGWLLTTLSSSASQTPRRHKIRLLLGTGFLGGFTTYSALATDSMLLIARGSALAGVGYALATVIIGALATWCGMLLGTKVGPSKPVK